MKGSTFLFCAALAAFCGLLAHQTVETLLNTTLTVLPFNIKTVR